MAVRGVLLDLEGVLYQGDAAIKGAIEAVARLDQAGLGLRFLTNTTVRPRGDIVARMRAMGFTLEPGHVFTPVMAAIRLLREAGIGRLHLAAEPRLAEDFGDFELVDAAPGAVVLGDLHRGFDWDRLNALYGMVRDGARLVALHKNRFCRRQGELELDLGPFVAALEYAAGTEAEVVGKPSPTFFAMARADLGTTPGETVMVGDDIEADIGGGQQAGLRAVQVRTGKYSRRDDSHPTVTPDARIDTIADLAEAIERM